VHTINLYC